MDFPSPTAISCLARSMFMLFSDKMKHLQSSDSKWLPNNLFSAKQAQNYFKTKSPPAVSHSKTRRTYFHCLNHCRSVKSKCSNLIKFNETHNLGVVQPNIFDLTMCCTVCLLLEAASKGFKWFRLICTTHLDYNSAQSKGFVTQRYHAVTLYFGKRAYGLIN